MPAFSRRFSFKDYSGDRWPQLGPRWSQNVAWPCDPSASNSGSIPLHRSRELLCKFRSGAVVESAGTHPVESGFLWRRSENNQDPSRPGNARKSRSLFYLLPRYLHMYVICQSYDRSARAKRKSPGDRAVVRLFTRLFYVAKLRTIEYRILAHCLYINALYVVWSTDYSCLFRKIRGTTRWFNSTYEGIVANTRNWISRHSETRHDAEILTKL